MARPAFMQLSPIRRPDPCLQQQLGWGSCKRREPGQGEGERCPRRRSWERIRGGRGPSRKGSGERGIRCVAAVADYGGGGGGDFRRSWEHGGSGMDVHFGMGDGRVNACKHGQGDRQAGLALPRGFPRPSVPEEVGQLGWKWQQRPRWGRVRGSVGQVTGAHRVVGCGVSGRCKENQASLLDLG